MPNASLTFEDTFVFSADVSDGAHRQRSVAVAFFANMAPNARQFADRLRDLFTTVPTAEELWIVAPEPLRDEALVLGSDREVKQRTGQAAALSCVRVVVFDGEGAWREIQSDRPSDLSVTDASASVIQEGLRRLFRDCGALDTAHAGLHFRKPGGKHSTRFLRAGPAVQRSPHAHFVAAGLLPWAASKQFDRIWVDTGSIASVAYALAELRTRLTGAALVPVDSFGGYEGLKKASFTTPSLAIISATTSGSLSARMVELNLDATRQRTLFYVSDSRPDDSVLCDMTDRGDGQHPELVPPFPSWDEADCKLCKNGQNVVQLTGDAFVPDAGLATPLMLVAKYATQAHKDFVSGVFGKNVIRLNASDQSGPEPTVRDVSVHFEELIAHDRSVQEAVDSTLARKLPFRTRYLIHLDDPMSRVLAERALELCRRRGADHVMLLSARDLQHVTCLSQGVSVVLAGVVATGHELLNVSRELRTLVGAGGDIAYIIGCVRPLGSGVWRTTRSSLVFRSERPGEDLGPYPLDSVWSIEMEPNTEATNPWRHERSLLQLLARSARRTKSTTAVASIDRRLDDLNGTLGDQAGFLPSNFGSADTELPLTLNPNFAFWNAEMESLAAATHAEVYFTIASVLHRARHSDDAKFSLFEQPGFGHVLSPANFDRFNDPVIQAAILRGARGSELNFEDLRPQSQHMAAIIAKALKTWSDSQRGAAALEYTMSLVRGIENIGGGGIRLCSEDVVQVALAFRDVSPDEAPVLWVAGQHFLSCVGSAKDGG